MVDRSFVFLAVLTFFCVSSVYSASIPKCKSDDSKCIKDTTQALIPVFAKGLPEYDVNTMDPISIKRIDASSQNLKLILTDVVATGLKGCIAKKTKHDHAKKKMNMKLQCDVQLESQYEMDGQLLILPIKGKGPLHVTLRKLELSVEVEVREIEKNGLTHWDIKDWKHSFALKDKCDIVFENLFNGNEVLAQAAREVISSSGNEVILEVGPPTVKEIASQVIKNINNFFHKVPVKDLMIE